MGLGYVSKRTRWNLSVNQLTPHDLDVVTAVVRASGVVESRGERWDDREIDGLVGCRAEEERLGEGVRLGRGQGGVEVDGCMMLARRDL